MFPKERFVNSPEPNGPNFVEPHFNKLTPAEDERVTYLCEEALEVAKACTKILRHGWVCRDMSTEPMTIYDNRKHLYDELRDVYKAVIRLINAGELSHSVFRGGVVLNNTYFHHQGKGEQGEGYDIPLSKGPLPQDLLIDYTNWKGHRRIRPVRPVCIMFGSNEYHTVPQWLMEAYDLEDGGVKTFALSGIHAYLPMPGTVGPQENGTPIET